MPLASVSHDYVLTDEIILTQEILSHLLGVRREGVTVAAGRLQDAGLISYSRGHIHILDRPGLEKSVCECCQVVRDEYESLGKRLYFILRAALNFRQDNIPLR